MSRLTIKPTATKPYSESLNKASMSALATELDVVAATENISEAVATLGAESQADSTATDVAGLVVDFNALLAKLRTAGVLAV